MWMRINYRCIFIAGLENGHLAALYIYSNGQHVVCVHYYYSLKGCFIGRKTFSYSIRSLKSKSNKSTQIKFGSHLGMNTEQWLRKVSNTTHCVMVWIEACGIGPCNLCGRVRLQLKPGLDQIQWMHQRHLHTSCRSSSHQLHASMF